MCALWVYSAGPWCRILIWKSQMTPELLSTTELSQRSPELLSRIPQYSSPTEIPRVTYETSQSGTLYWMKRDWTLVMAEVTISAGLSVVLVMATMECLSLAWKPPWFCYQICKENSQDRRFLADRFGF
jgi:hypothetical protein